MGKLLAGLLIGILFGGVITFFTFVGVPRAAQLPGTPIALPDPNSNAGTAELVLKQDLLNDILQTIFRDMGSPAFQLTGIQDDQVTTGPAESAVFASQNACDGKISVLPQGSGVTTGVNFENGRIAAPLAFSGSYNSPFGCIKFTGWAKAILELRFDASRQTVYGQLDVETVNLDGVNPLLSGLITPIVQSTINSRVNPIEILRGEQIAPEIKLASTGGNLKAAVKDVRAEAKGDALNLFIIYTFSGSPGV
ncbi:MAG: hypothetical protein ABJA02_08565 [Acidobacteriota bacterium]